MGEQKENQSIGEHIKESGLISGVINNVLEEFGITNPYIRSLSNILGTGVYVIPGVGTALGIADMIQSLSRGNYAQAGLDAITALFPVTKGLKSAKTLAKITKSEAKAAKKQGREALTVGEKMFADRVKEGITRKYAEKVAKERGKSSIFTITPNNTNTISLKNNFIPFGNRFFPNMPDKTFKVSPTLIRASEIANLNKVGFGLGTLSFLEGLLERDSDEEQQATGEHWKPNTD